MPSLPKRNYLNIKNSDFPSIIFFLFLLLHGLFNLPEAVTLQYFEISNTMASQINNLNQRCKCSDKCAPLK